MTIPMGDSKIIIENGSIIIETKDKDKNTIFKDQSGKTYTDKNEAFAASAMAAAGVDIKDKNTYHYDGEG